MTGYPDHRNGGRRARCGVAWSVMPVVIACFMSIVSGTEPAACAPVRHDAPGVVSPAIMADVPPDWSQHGIASWYGTHMQKGRATASGQTFDPDALTAAHPRLPLGTRLRVHSRRTGRSVVVTVNDRGPYYGHRIIDLSAEAARRLGILSAGATAVDIEPAHAEDEVASAPR
ncbi:septal ring lytic transglycosylase RlpA family protein [Komagataeibacter sp. FNDCR2]|uniref:septal ring lytic transglycosylase RlpA family protein n=1 Tax=Komagataeibacter sp. FNDCR2 TaxID=2878682 RepID=UPI001E550078|nr:septal ring lytic transglycosylase RlpA family protein [Komagataeibacter sp. FNDCR2]MCE2575809.1 septal ring lytic transglycosylase RlpA family protein [Komagataeibacter sp. FNDCR2]